MAKAPLIEFSDKGIDRRTVHRGILPAFGGHPRDDAGEDLTLVGRLAPTAIARLVRLPHRHARSRDIVAALPASAERVGERRQGLSRTGQTDHLNHSLKTRHLLIYGRRLGKSIR